MTTNRNGSKAKVPKKVSQKNSCITCSSKNHRCTFWLLGENKNKIALLQQIKDVNQNPKKNNIK